MKAHRLGAALVAATLVVLTPAAATAQTRWFRDSQGDVAPSVDIHRVQVINGEPGNAAVRVSVVQRALLPGDVFDVWLDTVPADPGPEFRAAWIADSDSLALLRVSSFSDQGVAVSCPGFRVRGDVSEPRTASHVLMPRPCLGNPHAVRVSVRAERQVGSRLVKDWAPGALQFYDWVRQG